MMFPQTESSDMMIWMNRTWTIMPPLSIPVVVEAPVLFVDFKAVSPEETIPGEFSLIWLKREQIIDMHTHRTLLEKSLREYSNIWKKLAEV
jgi:hypothetical protein